MQSLSDFSSRAGQCSCQISVKLCRACTFPPPLQHKSLKSGELHNGNVNCKVRTYTKGQGLKNESSLYTEPFKKTIVEKSLHPAQEEEEEEEENSLNQNTSTCTP